MCCRAKTDDRPASGMIPYSDTIAVFITAFVLFSCIRSYFGSQKGGNERNLPPGRTPWPFLGNLPSMLGREPHKLVTEIAEQHDRGVITFYLGSSPIIVINRLDQAVEAYVRQDDAFSDRRIPPLPKKAFSARGSLIWENGASWRQNRRVVHSGFRKIEASEGGLTSKILFEMRQLFTRLDHTEGPVDLSENLMTFSAKLTCAIAFGGRSNALVGGKTFTDFLSSLRKISNNLTMFSLAAVFPPIYDTFVYREVRDCVKTVRKFLDDNLREHRRLYREWQIHDIMDVYCDVIGHQQNCPLDERDIWGSFLDLLGAGTDTTANTLLWGVMHMCAHPGYQEEMYQELKDACGDREVTTMALRDTLPLTHAVLLEVMRRVPVAPLGLPRVTSRRAELGGYDIPEGTDIWLNEYAIHHDEALWDEPERFYPERFLNQKRTAVLLEVKNRLVSFGLGRRVCLGKKLAEMELFLVFSNLFKRYRLEFAEPHQRFDPVGIFGLTYAPKSFKVVITRR